MQRLSTRTISTAIRNAATRHRPLSSSSSSDITKRWCSVLTTTTGSNDSSSPFNQLPSPLVGLRYHSTAAAAAAESTEKYEYQAEVSRLMDLIVNSLYSNKDVFLRELISNASDALDKLRFLSVTDPQILKDALDLDIRIHTDKDNGIITITDSGIGMTRQELVDCLGTIAQSGTAKFLKALKDTKDAGADSNLIGQFGVGFYSAFLVSERVEVSTKSPKSDKQYVWEGEANSSSYTIREETDPAKLLPRGTRLTLYLKHDDKGFAHPERVQKLVKNYSLFVSFPIYTWQEKGFTKEVEIDEDPAEANKDEQEGEVEKKKKKTKTVVERYWDWKLTNETQPIWLRNTKEVTMEEYNEFYKNTFNEYLEPLASSHFTTEGEVEFRSILYVPSIAPTGKDDIVNPKTKNIRLYVKRVFISDDFDGELFPRYLSFVKGVVDSNDLPLNVSREILQESRIVRIMRKRLVRKAFDMILGITMSEDKDDYVKFWENFGKHVKLGCIEDHENHKRIAPLLRFFSSQSEEDMIGLDEYVENMKPDQKDIYYIASDSVASARNTPFLEKLAQKDIEVLFLVDPIDEVAVQNLKSFKEKNFVDISKEDLDLAVFLSTMMSRTKLANVQRARPLFSGYSTMLQQRGPIELPKNGTTNDPASRVPRPQIGQNVPRKDKITFLVSTLTGIQDDNKELIYSTLDAWVAWEQNFPIGALKNVLLALEKEKQWHRMIQVIKWMLSKGQGTTRGTYGQLIEALDNDHRIEEADEVWKKKLGFDLHSVPWKLCKLMISVYYRNKKFEELVKLFEGLEGFDRKPPEKSIVQKVADAYELLGLMGEKEKVMKKYKDLFVESSHERKIGRTRFSPKKGKPIGKE